MSSEAGQTRMRYQLESLEDQLGAVDKKSSGLPILRAVTQKGFVKRAVQKIRGLKCALHVV